MGSLKVCIKKRKDKLQMHNNCMRKRRGEKIEKKRIERPVIAVYLLGSQKAILFF